MVVSLKPERLKRYKDVAMLLIKYGRSDLISVAGLEGSVLPDEIAAESEIDPAEDLAKDLEKSIFRVCAFRTGFRVDALEELAVKLL